MKIIPWINCELQVVISHTGWQGDRRDSLFQTLLFSMFVWEFAESWRAHYFCEIYKLRFGDKFTLECVKNPLVFSIDRWTSYSVFAFKLTCFEFFPHPWKIDRTVRPTSFKFHALFFTFAGKRSAVASTTGSTCRFRNTQHCTRLTNILSTH